MRVGSNHFFAVQVTGRDYSYFFRRRARSPADAVVYRRRGAFSAPVSIATGLNVLGCNGGGGGGGIVHA